MPRPGSQRRLRGQTGRTIRNLLAGSYPLVEGSNRTYDAPDFVGLAAVATGRHQSLAFASQTLAGSPDSDTFHHHLHAATPTQVFDAFQVSLNGLVDVARQLRWLDEPVIVAIDRHNEPVYGEEQPWMVGMQEKAGTNRAHAYLTSQRVREPRLTLDLQLLDGLRDQHAALADLLAHTRQRQRVLAYLLDKGFYSQADLTLLVATNTWIVVPVPLSKHVHKAAGELHRTRTRLDFNRHVATRRHRVGDDAGGIEIVQVFVWEPDAKEPSGERLFVYACPHERNLAELYEWSRIYRQRWGIETGYRQLEAVRLRTTSHAYANRLYLTLVAVLLDTVWRLVRHARRLRGAPHAFTVPQFLVDLQREPSLVPS